MHLVKPATRYLQSYIDAIENGWSPSNVRGAEIAREHLDAIRRDAAAFVESLDDPEARASPEPRCRRRRQTSRRARSFPGSGDRRGF